MKQVTGDPDITVHATRHTFASTEVERSLLDGMMDFKEVRGLDRLRVRMGHADPRTTLMTYCHLYEDVLRECIDMAIQQLGMSVRAVAEWIVPGAGKAHERKQCLKRVAARFRQEKRRKPAWTAMGEMIKSVALMGPFERADAAIGKKALSEPKRLTLDCVHHIAKDWAAKMNPERIHLRSGHPIEVVNKVIGELETACEQVHRARHARKAVGPEWVSWLADEVNLSRLGSDRWAPAMKLLESEVDEAQSVPLTGWLQACAGIGIDGGQPSLAQVLLFLSRAKFGVENFVIRGIDHTQIERVSDVFMDAFTRCAQTELVKARGDKPAGYVQILTRPARPEALAASATSDMKTLRALMLLGLAYQNVRTRVEGA
jgi:hypothetical protein